MQEEHESYIHRHFYPYSNADLLVSANSGVNEDKRHSQATYHYLHFED